MKRQPPQPTKRYELWRDAEGGHVLLSENHSQKDVLIPQPATLLTVIEAPSWEKALCLRDVYLKLIDPRDCL